MKQFIRRLLIKASIASRTKAELMPSSVLTNEDYSEMTVVTAEARAMEIISEGVKAGLTEWEADMVREELMTSVKQIIIGMEEIIHEREWQEMKLKSSLRKVNMEGLK